MGIGTLFYRKDEPSGSAHDELVMKIGNRQSCEAGANMVAGKNTVWGVRGGPREMQALGSLMTQALRPENGRVALMVPNQEYMVIQNASLYHR